MGVCTRQKDVFSGHGADEVFMWTPRNAWWSAREGEGRAGLALLLGRLRATELVNTRTYHFI